MTQVDQIAHKRTKTPFRLVPLAFVAEMAHVMAAGLKVPGRYVDSWKQLDPAELPMYLEGIQRHLQAEEEAGPLAIDPDTNKPHLVHIACGAMIAWWLARKARGMVGAECAAVAEADTKPADPRGLGAEWALDERSSFAECWRHPSSATIARVVAGSPWYAWDRRGSRVASGIANVLDAAALALGAPL
jgi:hypothetical protein